MPEYDSQSGSRGSAARFVPAQLRPRLWWPLAFAAVFALAAAFYALALPDRYTATAQILIDPQLLNPQPAPGGDLRMAYLDTQARIIASTDMLRRLVDREGLAQEPAYAGAPSVLARLFAPRDVESRMQRIIERLGRDLSVRRDDRTFVIDIAVSAATPDLAARIANALAAAYLEDRAAAQLVAAGRTSSESSARLDGLRERVRRSEVAVETARARPIGGGAAGRQGGIDPMAAALSSQLAFAKARTADARAKLEQLESARSLATDRGAVPEAINSQSLGLMRAAAAEAQARVARLRTQLGSMHPDYIAAQEALRDAQRGVAEEIARIRAAARAELDRATSAERALQAQMDRLPRQTPSSDAETLEQRNLEQRNLERALEADRAAYQAELERSRASGQGERADAGSARIIGKAAPPVERSGPPRRDIVLATGASGFVLGLLLTIAAAFLSRPPRQSVKTSDDDARVRAARQRADPPPAAQSFGQQPLTPEELTRLLDVLGRLERTIRQHGLP